MESGGVSIDVRSGHITPADLSQRSFIRRGLGPLLVVKFAVTAEATGQAYVLSALSLGTSSGAGALAGLVVLVEVIDRLSGLPRAYWKALRVVAVDLPTSHQAMSAGDGQEITDCSLDAINRMMVDMMAAIARKDCADRLRRQAA